MTVWKVHMFPARSTSVQLLAYVLRTYSWFSGFSGALFTSEKILDFDTVAFSFVCGKYYLIIN